MHEGIPTLLWFSVFLACDYWSQEAAKQPAFLKSGLPSQPTYFSTIGLCEHFLSTPLFRNSSKCRCTRLTMNVFTRRLTDREPRQASRRSPRDKTSLRTFVLFLKITRVYWPSADRRHLSSLRLRLIKCPSQRRIFLHATSFAYL